MFESVRTIRAAHAPSTHVYTARLYAYASAAHLGGGLGGVCQGGDAVNGWVGLDEDEHGGDELAVLLLQQPLPHSRR